MFTLFGWMFDFKPQTCVFPFVDWGKYSGFTQAKKAVTRGKVNFFA